MNASLQTLHNIICAMRADSNREWMARWKLSGFNLCNAAQFYQQGVSRRRCNHIINNSSVKCQQEINQQKLKINQ